LSINVYKADFIIFTKTIKKREVFHIDGDEMADKLTKEIKERRKANYKIHPLILNRWSPRAMTGEELKDEELMPLFEAARWAPSSFNGQLWRFIYAKRNTPHWNTLFGLLGDWNKIWCKNAAVLVVVSSRKNFEYNDKPSVTHGFDAGSAWENLALEATSRGLVAHGMEGFDYAKAKSDLGIPDDYEVHAMIAIGKRAKKEALEDQKMQEMEFPNDRRPLKEIIMEGKFRK
jgi:nitroreductase